MIHMVADYVGLRIRDEQGAFPKGFQNTVSGGEMFKQIQMMHDNASKLRKVTAK